MQSRGETGWMADIWPDPGSGSGPTYLYSQDPPPIPSLRPRALEEGQSPLVFSVDKR